MTSNANRFEGNHLWQHLPNIERWLRRQFRAKVALSLATTIFSLVGGMIVLIITFFFAYAAVWFGFNYGVSSFVELIFGRDLHLTHSSILCVCSLFVMLAFVENALIHSDYYRSYDVRFRAAPGVFWIIGIFGAVAVSLVNGSATTKSLADLILSGPRLIVNVAVTFKETLRLARTNVRICAQALIILTAKSCRVSLRELLQSLPKSDPTALLFALRHIDGILLIGTEPAVFILTDALRTELRRFSDPAGSYEQDESENAGPTVIIKEMSIYEVLGVSPSSSMAEIKAAYRNSIKMYHPDKFANQPPEIRRSAEEMSKVLNAAYDTIVRKHATKETEDV